LQNDEAQFPVVEVPLPATAEPAVVIARAAEASMPSMVMAAAVVAAAPVFKSFLFQHVSFSYLDISYDISKIVGKQKGFILKLSFRQSCHGPAAHPR
jgi:hypothetical protein